MIIAEEMNLDPDQVVVTLADARPELVFNQLTGGSTTTFSTYTPIRVAAALAQGRLLDAAAAQLGQEKSVLTSRTGLILGQNGEELPFGELTEAAASPVNDAVEVVLKPREEFSVIGTPRTKSDARAMVGTRSNAHGSSSSRRRRRNLNSSICRTAEPIFSPTWKFRPVRTHKCD